MKKFKPLIIFFTLIVLGVGIFLIFNKPKKSFNFKIDNLDKIEIIIIGDRSKEINKEDFQQFLDELNNLKYKPKKTGIKTNGIHFIKLHYKNQLITIGKYRTDLGEKIIPTIFDQTFDDLLTTWIDK